MSSVVSTTPYELWIARHVQAGELCPTVLDHGDFCGREIDTNRGCGLCVWHTDVELGVRHLEDGVESPNTCIRCGKKPVSFRVTRLCGNCQKVTMQRERRRLKSEEIAVGQIVER